MVKDYISFILFSISSIFNPKQMPTRTYTLRVVQVRYSRVNINVLIFYCQGEIRHLAKEGRRQDRDLITRRIINFICLPYKQNTGRRMNHQTKNIENQKEITCSRKDSREKMDMITKSAVCKCNKLEEN